MTLIRRLTWLLQNDFPIIQAQLYDATGFRIARTLLADTGAGPRHVPFELILSDLDLERFGGRLYDIVRLSGTLSGEYPIYSVWIEIPALSFLKPVRAVAVPSMHFTAGFAGIACFRFLNNFNYGNFGNANQFGLETY